MPACPRPNKPWLEIPLEQLRAAYSYDPATGEIRHLLPDRGPRVQGAIAGTLDRLGYRHLNYRKRFYKGHRVAWALHYGAWPEGEIDHINGDPGDNRIVNLRICTRLQNQMNRAAQKNNKLGKKGVQSIYEGRRYRAKISLRGKTIHLGCFKRMEDAVAAREAAERRLFGEFARVASGGAK
jgi:hypothetical protein